MPPLTKNSASIFKGTIQSCVVLLLWHRSNTGFRRSCTFFLRLAANQGYAGAQLKLGTCYYEGKGVAKDLGDAVHFYRLAVKQEETKAKAQSLLDRCLEDI